MEFNLELRGTEGAEPTDNASISGIGVQRRVQPHGSCGREHIHNDTQLMS